MFVGRLRYLFPFKHLFEAGTFELLADVIFTDIDFEWISDNRLYSTEISRKYDHAPPPPSKKKKKKRKEKED